MKRRGVRMVSRLVLLPLASALMLPVIDLQLTVAHGTPVPSHHDATETAKHGDHPGQTGTSSAAGTVVIDIDGSITYQIFSGVGGTLSIFEDNTYQAHDSSQPASVSATEEDREGIASLLYEQIGLTRARVFLAGFEPANDNDDPRSIDSDAFDWTATNPETAFIKIARERGLTTFWTTFSIWSAAESWLRPPGPVCGLDPAKIDEYVEWLLAAELRLRDEGLLTPYLAIVNEPDFAPNCGNEAAVISVDATITIIKRLGARLREEGLPAMFVVSDGLNPERALPYMEAVLVDPEARPYVGALAYHSYSGPYPNARATLETSGRGQPDPSSIAIREGIAALAAQYGLPVWMTEVCVCVDQGDNLSAFDMGQARLNHFFDEWTFANVSAIDVMNLFFIERLGVGDELVHIFFRSDGVLDRYEIAPYGYLVGQITRFVSSGSIRIEAMSSESLVRVVSFVRPDGRVVVVAINNADNAVYANIALRSLEWIPSTLPLTTSEDGAYWTDGGRIDVVDGVASVPLPAKSVVTLEGE